MIYPGFDWTALSLIDFLINCLGAFKFLALAIQLARIGEVVFVKLI